MTRSAVRDSFPFPSHVHEGAAGARRRAAAREGAGSTEPPVLIVSDALRVCARLHAYVEERESARRRASPTFTRKAHCLEPSDKGVRRARAGICNDIDRDHKGRMTMPPKLQPSHPRTWTGSTASRRIGLVAGVLLLTGAAEAAQFTLNGPAGSGEFGRSVTFLPNGNLVVTDPLFDAPGPISDAGAVRLYSPTGNLLSTLRGSAAGSRVGSGGIVVLPSGNFLVRSPHWGISGASNMGSVTFADAERGVDGTVSSINSLVGGRPDDNVGRSAITVLSNGNYVVASPEWDNGTTVDAGAVTFGSGASGISGLVSSSNSLVGSRERDQVGEGVTALSNGNYVVNSPGWDNGTMGDAGAVTFGNGMMGIRGVVSAANSLVGALARDGVGRGGIVPLDNGNYLVRSIFWRSGSASEAGAVTFGSGTTGISGVVSATNSLVGQSADDWIGYAVRLLSNGNYVVISPFWRNGDVWRAGAVTFGSGTSGVSGYVSEANSLVGGSDYDFLGEGGVTPLANGNYVVLSPRWNNGELAEAGAATFASGTSGLSGRVSALNSLVGSASEDRVGGAGAIALVNGNYVVRSPFWRRGALAEAGAVTFGSGTSGISGAISLANSLLGSTAFHRVGNAGVVALRNGNYVVVSTDWDSGLIRDVGAVTLGLGTSGISGPVSGANSLIGSRQDDRVGGQGVVALDNGNYVIASARWDNDTTADVGAVTFASGGTGISGSISPVNSLIGSRQGDRVGGWGVTPLAGGNYIVSSPEWDNGSTVDAGAATLGNGTAGSIGAVSAANSLVGSSADDRVSANGVTALPNGNYVIVSAGWDNGSLINAGAVTLGLSDGSVSGAISNANSVRGTVANQGASHSFSYDPVRNQLAVGQPASNRVVLQRPGIATSLSLVSITPDPSLVGEPVLFTATLVASQNSVTDGRVTFTASNGQSCADTTPTAVAANAFSFSCTIVFAAAGSVSVVAKYTGSLNHAYSGSEPRAHTTVSATVFANGFEGP